MNPLVSTRLTFSIARFESLRPVLEPLLSAAIKATNRVYDHGDAKQPEEVLLLVELSHVYAGAVLEVMAAFFARMATWAQKPRGKDLDIGFAVNGVGLTLAAWAGSNNHKHWQEWNRYQHTGKPFKQNQLDSMEPLARVFFNDGTIRFVDDASARVLKVYSDDSYDVLEKRVLEALALIAGP